MIKSKEVLIPEHITLELEAIVCDNCKTEISVDDVMEIQEVHTIRFVGGYSSVFGDGNQIECHLCQRCLYEMIKDCLRVVDETE